MIGQVLASSGSDSGGAGAVVAVVLFIISFVFYWIPTMVAVLRKVPNTGSVVVINLFLGWTIIGWVVALAMAMRSRL